MTALKRPAIAYLPSVYISSSLLIFINSVGKQAPHSARDLKRNDQKEIEKEACSQLWILPYIGKNR
jgi:hypothetical protein